MTEHTFGQGSQHDTATNMATDTPETDTAERMAYAGEYMVPTEIARRLERERDEAREALANETSFHHRTHSELIEAQCKLMDATQAIITTLEENRYLADGDDCTLAKLKSVVSGWK